MGAPLSHVRVLPQGAVAKCPLCPFVIRAGDPLGRIGPQRIEAHAGCADDWHHEIGKDQMMLEEETRVA